MLIVLQFLNSNHFKNKVRKDFILRPVTYYMLACTQVGIIKLQPNINKYRND